MSSVKTYFVIGTDTSVGKTLVTASLCATLSARGLRVGVFKPLESGCASNRDGLKRHVKRADALFLKKIAGVKEPLDDINPYFFGETLAPGVAAQRQRTRVSLSKIKRQLEVLKKKYDLVFVEGAGGLLVPVSGQKTNLDLIKLLKGPVLLIARLGLGTLNHTLLTLEHLRRHRIKVAGVILNETVSPSTLAEKTNPSVLAKFGVPLVGIFPFLRKKTKRALMAAAEKNLRDWLDRVA